MKPIAFIAGLPAEYLVARTLRAACLDRRVHRIAELAQFHRDYREPPFVIAGFAMHVELLLRVVVELIHAYTLTNGGSCSLQGQPYRPSPRPIRSAISVGILPSPTYASSKACSMSHAQRDGGLSGSAALRHDRQLESHQSPYCEPLLNGTSLIRFLPA